MPNWKLLVVSGSDANLKSLVVSQSITAESFTGSLYGTASYSEYFTSYSYVTHSLEITRSIYVDTASISLNANQYTFYVNSATSSWNINHGLNTMTPILAIYDGENEQVQPDRVKALGLNDLRIDFTHPVSGTVKIINIS